MSTSAAELLADAAATGREVEMACGSCPETWIVFVPEGEFPTFEQAMCPVNDGHGEGEEC